MKSITILGSGAWGTAIATVLAHNGHRVTIWSHEAQSADEINQRHTNSTFLPEVLLHESISATTSLPEACRNSEWIFEAVPVQFLRSVFVAAACHIRQDHKFVLLSKGIEQETALLPSQILLETCGSRTSHIVVSGPSFAKDLAQKQLTGVIAATAQISLLNDLKNILENDYFKIIPSTDVVGVQLCAALKNVITFGIGVLDGAGYTDNTKSLFFVKILEETKTLMSSCKGQPETLLGLAGIGDLVLTAFGKHSRNLAAGQRVGKGESISSIQASLEAVPEAFNSVISVKQLIATQQLSLSLFEGLYSIMQGAVSVPEFIKNL